MENKYHTIIIGGGLSGCTLGYLLKKQGHNVLIVEKVKIDDKDKLCGGLLTQKSVTLLKALFNDSEIEALIEGRYNNAIMQNKGKDILIENIRYFTLYRKNLDKYILNHYLAAGGELIDNITFREVNPQHKTIAVGNNTYQYDYLVGADGVFSPLRQHLTGKKPDKASALETYSNNADKNSTPTFSFFDNFKGYAWIIPNKNNVPIGAVELHRNTKHTKAILEQYLNRAEVKNYKLRGAFLPTGRSVLLHIGNSIFFTGDSAGLIDPITGEGIYYALLSAKVLSETMNSAYAIKMKPAIKHIKHVLFYSKFVYNHRLRNFMFARYYTSKRMKRLIDKFAERLLLG